MISIKQRTLFFVVVILVIAALSFPFLSLEYENIAKAQKTNSTLLQDISIDRKTKKENSKQKDKKLILQSDSVTNKIKESDNSATPLAKETLVKAIDSTNVNVQSPLSKEKPLKTLNKTDVSIPEGILSKEYIKSLSKAELNLIRAKTYLKYGYDFFALWGANFHKSKYGYIIKTSPAVFNRLRKEDKVNETNIINQLKRQHKTRRISLPIYTGHIMREVNYNKPRQRYYQDIKDLTPLEKERFGIVQPSLGKEITRKDWNALISGKKNFFSLNIPLNKEKVYLVLYYNKTKIKYIISYDVFAGHIGPQDAKNFSVYDRKGRLRRHIFVGNQEIYESDYLYDKDELEKVVEKIIVNNKSIKVNVYTLKYGKP